MKTQDFIVGALSIITLLGIILLTILQLDTQVLTATLGTLIGYFVGTKRQEIGAYFGGIYGKKN